MNKLWKTAQQLANKNNSILLECYDYHDQHDPIMHQALVQATGKIWESCEIGFDADVGKYCVLLYFKKNQKLITELREMFESSEQQRMVENDEQ